MKKIKFVSINKLSHLIQDKPKPSRLHIPEWYKKVHFIMLMVKKKNKHDLFQEQATKILLLNIVCHY